VDSGRWPRWIFLPGLDGTGTLFDEVLEQLPDGVDAFVVRYPKDVASSAAELVRLVEAALPAEGEYAIIAESFSGPLALRSLSSHRGSPVALVLCSSFGRSPLARAACALMRLLAPAALHCQVPRWLIRRYLVGDDRDRLIPQFRNTLAALSGEALASRFKALGEFTDAFVPRRLAVPILYIRATQDRLVRSRDLAWLQGRYVNLRVREVEAPHFVLQCQPKAVVGLIVDFLSRLPAIESEL